MIEVKATRKGFHDRLYQPGERFKIDEKLFSPVWMERVKQKRKAKPEAPELPET